MKTTLMLTAAAALLMGAGPATAQTLDNVQPERAPAAQRNAPAEKIAPPMNAGKRKAPETTGQASGVDKLEPASGKAHTTGQGTIDSKPQGHKKPETSGQGAAGAAKLSSQQRFKITTIISKQKVAPAKLDISISVGARVPSHVHFYPVPTEVVEIYPEWEGYLFIFVADEIVIVHPRSHVIVAVLEV